MPRHRILITGTGAVCASGMNPGAVLAAILEGRSAIGPITQWDTTGWPVCVAAEMPDFNPHALVEDRKLHNFFQGRRYPDTEDLVNAHHALKRIALDLPRLEDVQAICPLSEPSRRVRTMHASRGAGASSGRR